MNQKKIRMKNNEMIKKISEEEAGNRIEEVLKKTLPLLMANIKSIVREHCAKYSRIGPFKTINFCWGAKENEPKCRYFLDEENGNAERRRCKYFEEYVLPLDNEVLQNYNIWYVRGAK